ncbi:dolichol-phosphate mannosyltransferase [Aquimarina amphilecti]|uniref:Dolichol-phosphate mannosyltransferase n=1 Tax=Aquimarina amphilecti TaxID=1038014 RepID=A0A1H7WIL3_AQUAM|nr:glycosyltransferase family 2 protein [Aquimarina amphilecti]SEM20727.1 dolichol-phosphate mannosyltransferase [Aquimarina amphilecti]
MKLSIISPVYKAENIIPLLIERINQGVTKVTDDYEIILVEDNSPDDSWAIIKDIATINKKVIGIKLSRNFGQHYAITAGLHKATGDWIVVMDCDLQDQPEEIEKLYNKTKEGYDIVLARRKVRKDSFFKKMFSIFFYKMLSFFTDTKQDRTVANFGIYHKKVIESVLKMGDVIRVFPIMIQWVGFSKTAIDVDHSKREIGKSTYTFSKLFKLAVNTFLTFSNKPLMLTVRFGFLISLFSFLVGCYYLFKYLTNGIVILGYTSLILSIWFLAGIIIFSIGILGLYVGKIFDTAKKRPTFIIDETIE